jgi:hypothetical protein
MSQPEIFHIGTRHVVISRRAPLAEADSRPTRGKAGTPGFTALPLSWFVGRTRETDAISDLLRRDATRLVTLTGPGGGSKIRLAIHIAEAVAHSTGLLAIPVAVVTAASGRHHAVVRGIAHGEHVRSFGREGTCVWGAEAPS